MQPACCITGAVNRYPRLRHCFQQLLTPVIQCATQLESTLHQRIIRDKGVRPHRLHQFLLTDQLSGVLHQVLEGFINLRTQLDLRARPEARIP